MATLTKAQQIRLKEINEDPVLWAQTFLRTYDARLGKETRWTARWYQVEMLRDKTTRRVYRCGRRTGKTETMVVDSLYHAVTHPNFRVLIVTPYENQVRLAFTRLNELINASPLIKARVISSTKNPYKIDFDNSSGIWGFTTGASTGSGAASIRGQRADMIVMDEVDSGYICSPL